MIPARLFAAMYDRMMVASEEAGLRERRREVVSRARGRVLEIGAGTGLNLAHYGPEVTQLVLTEPEEPMARRLRERLHAVEAAAPAVAAAEVVVTGAERLPFDDGAFDSVVSTLVLCTVTDPQQATAEIRRVLAPGGQLLLFEHVRADDPGLAKWQDRLERPWHWVARGCHPNRDVAALLRSAGFDVQVEPSRIPKAAPLVKPAITGTATPNVGATPA